MSFHTKEIDRLKNLIFGEPAVQDDFTNFQPLSQLTRPQSIIKKTMSVIVREAKIVCAIATSYRMSINELINTALDFYIQTFFDYNEQNEIVMETDSFSLLKKYAIAHSQNEAAFLREAFEIYVRLIQDRVLDKIYALIPEIKNVKQLAIVIAFILDKSLQETKETHNGTETNKIVIGEDSVRQSILPMYAFKPLHKFKNDLEITTKKQSIVVKDSEIINKITDYYHWSINELINVALDVYIMSLFDRDIKCATIVESDCLITTRKYAVAAGITESSCLRNALEIYIRLVQDELVNKIKDLNIFSHRRTLQGIISELLSEATASL